MPDTHAASPRLWEPDHPYYCADVNFYDHETRIEQGAWTEWLVDAGNVDRDLNLVFRWDWHRPDGGFDDDDGREYLELFVMMQRKGRFVVWVFDVTSQDEPSVREWLQPSWDKMRAMWAPIAEGNDHAVG